MLWMLGMPNPLVIPQRRRDSITACEPVVGATLIAVSGVVDISGKIGGACQRITLSGLDSAAQAELLFQQLVFAPLESRECILIVNVAREKLGDGRVVFLRHPRFIKRPSARPIAAAAARTIPRRR